MAYAVQYDFFESNDELSLTRREVQLIKKELTNVRRGAFAELNSMKKNFNDKFEKQQEELEIIKKKMQSKAQVLDFPTSIRSKSC